VFLSFVGYNFMAEVARFIGWRDFLKLLFTKGGRAAAAAE
jgi:hypothetical protein